MGRKPKYSKEIKIKACNDYEKGNGSLGSIAKSIGTSYSNMHHWYEIYQEYGVDAFETSNRNNSYTKEFKLSVVDDYSTGKHSISKLAGKYNIACSVVKNWVNKCYNGIENKDYDPKGEVYTMKSRKTTFEVRQKSEYKTVDFFKDEGFPVIQICEVLNISRSSYYKHKNKVKSDKEKQDAWLL